MRSTKGNIHSSSIHEEEEEFDEDFSANKDGTSTSKDGNSNDRANAIRSKHSVTEQRRRCKINDRFQMLRDLIPHGDHKRDTASFLLEVIEYVKLLQEKVQKYEGSCEEWNTEPAKLMPWRYSHWRNQSLLKADADQDALPSPFQVQMPPRVHTDDVFSHPSQGMVLDSQSSDCPITSDNRQDEHSIEGGTISISNTYSQELLTTLTQALQSSGVDLSKARISIQIDLGKRANQALAPDVPYVKEHENSPCTLGLAHQREGIHRELEQAHKRLKT